MSMTKVYDINVTLDGEELHFQMNEDATNIVDAAFEAGITLPSSCRSGSCCTCRALVTEGEVVMETNMALDDDEVEEGYTLSCQARPVTGSVSLDFDAD
uniref:Ferredoxin component of carbazole 1,9a-dioxygenase n=2 Tax=Unclassified Bacteria TaxID=49928 RepID=C4B8F2_UNCXX|nr:ferredoxin component of carbazole 1,9a-dioxygenase [carbazole-degrading bacterium OC9]BAH60851.1 ferredoxin component of carbazole 1,9a-dioxygenase [carbazole-degrading bacterium OC11S]